MSKYSTKFSWNSKKRKLKKGKENLEKVLDKFYFNFEKILNNLWNFETNFEKTGNFVNGFMKHNIKK